MGDSVGETTSRQTVTVRYWASARAAAGVDQDVLEMASPVTLDRVLAEAKARHRDLSRFVSVVSVCSVLVGDRPVGAQDHEQVVVPEGDTVELLPPFAGGAR